MCSGTETLCLLPPPFVDASGGHMLRTQRGRLTRWESRWCTYVYENATLLRILQEETGSAHRLLPRMRSWALAQHTDTHTYRVMCVS